MDQTQVADVYSIQDFLDCLRETEIVSLDEIAKAALLPLEGRANGLSLAHALVTAGVLTSFQAEAICNQKPADLRIGNYDVLDRLGAGGMGTVFKARHRRMKRIVALKVLSPKLAKDDSYLQRFQREVEMIARFSHPNIVMAYDADEADAGHFLVMEYVDGQDLASLLEKQGPLSVSVAVNSVLQAARGLEYAHTQGIIHRDIKPANLLRNTAGIVKVADLGLARVGGADTGSGAGAITQAGSILGTVDYMPPEQAMGAANIDHRADIYSLGATLHFLLLGRPPYQGESMMATLLNHKLAPVPSLRKARPEIPIALDEVFARMLAKEPANRFQKMAEVVSALEIIEGNLLAIDLPSSCSVAGNHAVTLEGPSLSPRSHNRETSMSTASGLTEQTIHEAPPQSVATTHAGLKVLLVEPSRTQSGIIRKYLLSQGVKDVVSAVTGHEALQAIRNETPDTIVAALHLPDMTGVQLAQQIRSQTKGTTPSFVLISSESESSDVGSLSACGRAVLVKKPFTPEQLAGAIRLVSRAAKPTSVSKDFAKVRVLIVDDSGAARLHVRRTLSEMGLTQFVEAVDGAQGVAALAGKVFDLIVTDYNMPFMDGRSLVGYLRQNPATAKTPIVMVTTETDPIKLGAVRALGVEAICDKSFPPETVRKVLEKMTAAER